MSEGERMGMIEKMLDARRNLTPTEGFNLVGIDDFEPFGEELYLVGHFATKEEAIAEQQRRDRLYPGHTYVIYGPED